jgi:hypothetical protein
LHHDPVEFASTTNKVLLNHSPENAAEIFTPAAHGLFDRIYKMFQDLQD